MQLGLTKSFSAGHMKSCNLLLQLMTKQLHLLQCLSTLTGHLAAIITLTSSKENSEKAVLIFQGHQNLSKPEKDSLS